MVIRSRLGRSVVSSALFGLGATLSVAWCLWAYVNPTSGRATVLSPMTMSGTTPILVEGPLVWKREQAGCEEWHVTRVEGDETEGVIEASAPRWTGLWPRDWGAFDASGAERTAVAYGWPGVALFARHDSGPARAREGVPFPLRPVWRGLVMDSALFGAAFWAVVFGPRAWLRWVRRAQGVCPDCGYDLRGEFVRGCSECGWGVSEA